MFIPWWPPGRPCTRFFCTLPSGLSPRPTTSRRRVRLSPLIPASPASRRRFYPLPVDVLRVRDVHPSLARLISAVPAIVFSLLLPSLSLRFLAVIPQVILSPLSRCFIPVLCAFSAGPAFCCKKRRACRFLAYQNVAGSGQKKRSLRRREPLAPKVRMARLWEAG